MIFILLIVIWITVPIAAYKLYKSQLIKIDEVVKYQKWKRLSPGSFFNIAFAIWTLACVIMAYPFIQMFSVM